MSKLPESSQTLRKAWRTFVPPHLRRYGQGAAIALSQRRVETILARGEPELKPGPLIVSGFIGGTKGISRAARLTIAGLKAADFPVISHDLESLFSASGEQGADLPAKAAGGVWVLHANAPEAIAAMSRINPGDWVGRYRIGYWAYELPKIPAQWVRASSAFHEIWTPSRFVADALLASGVSKPVRVMPHPVMLDHKAEPHTRQETSTFTVLTMGDLKSSAARKNLLGAIEIYTRAFPTAGADACLILKLQSDDAYPEFLKAAQTLAAGRGDILFRTEQLSDAEIAQLIASASVVLSPHRSEGFGLTLAEAFLADVPALATGWSGNLDFMHDVPELLIRHTMVPVRDPRRIYTAPGQKWADPDMEDGARKLRLLADNPSLRRDLARRGRDAVEALHVAWTRDALLATPVGKYTDVVRDSGQADGGE